MAKKISQLNVASAIGDTDSLVIVQGGVTMKIASSLARVVNFLSGGIAVGTRLGINLIQGLNIAITAVDNSASNRVDVTIASTAVAADDPAIKINKYRLTSGL